MMALHTTRASLTRCARMSAWLLAVMAVLLFARGAAAQEQTLEERVDELERKLEEQDKRSGGGGMMGEMDWPDISGFVDASWTMDSNKTQGDGNDSNSFQLDGVEIDIEKTFAENDDGYGAALRADIDFAVDDGGAGASLEQGYMDVMIPVGEGLTFTFGRFNAPIGWELLDAPDMYQYSHANVFDLGIPSNLTGIKLAYTFPTFTGVMDEDAVIDVQIYAANGWDNNVETNDGKTIGGRVGITPMDGVNVGLSGITGPEVADSDSDIRTVVDIDATFDRIDNLVVGGEFNYGTEDNASFVDGGNARWMGGLVTVNYAWNDWFGTTARADFFDDHDGARTESIEGHTLISYTGALTFSITDGAGFLIEIRHDTSDENVFEDGDGEFQKENTTAAVEFTYTF